MKLPICDITPFTMQDFPNHTACILWFGGCNMRCAYCHNPELVLGKKKLLLWDEVVQFLQERSHLLDGVVLSGGECTLSPRLPEFVQYLHSLGYKVKLDTNGLRPDMLADLLQNGQLDYVALDYKAPEKKFLLVTGKKDFADFKQSLALLCENNVPFEIRTTVHTALMDEDDVEEIMLDIQKSGFTGNYYIQNFQSAPETLKPLPEQNRKLNTAELYMPETFKVHSRNF